MDHTGGMPFEVTAEWLERHGITPAMLNRLTDTELAVLGVDVRSARLESAGGVLDGVAGRLDLILDDPRASQALAAGRPMLGAVEILHSLGMDVGMIRAGMRLGRWSRAGDVHDPDMLRAAWDRIPGRGARTTSICAPCPTFSTRPTPSHSEAMNVVFPEKGDPS